MSEALKKIDQALDASLQMGLDENFTVDDSFIDWRKGIKKAYEEKDIVRMKQDQTIAAQYALNEMAHEAESESVRADLLKFIVGQAGHGVIQKVETLHDYRRMPDLQLRTIIRSKLLEIKRKNPNFDITALLPSPALSGIELESQAGVFAPTSKEYVDQNLMDCDE